MAKRLSLDEKLASVRRLRELGPSPEATAELRAALRDRSNLVVAIAASVASDQKCVELVTDLETAFDRFMVDPAMTDKLCRAKNAIVQGLDQLEHESPDVFLRAFRHVQFEPVFGGREDMAASLRAAAIVGLARLGHRSLLPLLIDALVDPKKEVILAGAQALGDQGTEAATLLLRLKARAGDNEPDVVSECLFALLSASPKESLTFVAEFLDSRDTATSEAAMMALGRSRLEEGFDLLKAFAQKHPIGSHDTLYMAMAMLRLPVANEFLLEIVAAGPEKNAMLALSALLIYRYDPNLRERIIQAVTRSARPALQARLERDADSGESG
jgi:HEAT repeat protein